MPEPTSDELEVARILSEMLPNPYFFTPITLDDIRLEGGYPSTRLVVLLRERDRPDTLYGLVTVLSDWDFPGAGLGEVTPRVWAGWVNDLVMETVDADPGLPRSAPGPDGVVWIDMDA
jgi:hypothetical protein